MNLEVFRAAIAKIRKHAGFFSWPDNRQLEECGVVQSLAEAMEHRQAKFFEKWKSRGRHNDPPDIEAVDDAGRRMGIEVTELVNVPRRPTRRRKPATEIVWDRAYFLQSLKKSVQTKDDKFPVLKGAPYPGGYVLVIYTDEAQLDCRTAQDYLAAANFDVMYLDRAFLLLSYDPKTQDYPYFELSLMRLAAPASPNALVKP